MTKSKHSIPVNKAKTPGKTPPQGGHGAGKAASPRKPGIKKRSRANAAFAAPERAGPQGAPLERPEILAPAGDMPSALAAFAAGADAVYLGLKHFSARMQAENFGTSELGALVDLAHERGRRVYVAMNTLVKPGEAAKAYRLLRRLVMNVGPDALIIQDLAVPDLARQAGFAGELHFSTLANITHQKALLGVRSMGAARVILPRELSFDEIRLMDQACPEDLDLELFVHGALCYCVSGRCWWSGYMGGKSGLRGRCVQPCRRVYVQKGREGRFFSCRDLSLDSEARSLLALPRVRSWKIEGRKKSPHYVYHVVSAYRLLRDEPSSAECRREAERLLGAALGRPVTRSLFLDAKASPTAPAGGKDAETSSGLMAGKIRKSPDNRYVVKPRLDLLPRDFLRVGYEDEAWHCTLSLATGAKKGQELPLALPRGKYPKDGAPVFLIDRKDPALREAMSPWLSGLQGHAATRKKGADVAESFPGLPAPLPKAARGKRLDLLLRSSLPQGRDAKAGLAPGAVRGLWLSPSALRDVSRTLYGRISWWLPPVIWPDEEDRWAGLVRAVIHGGAGHLVLNAPWQAALVPDRAVCSLTAGPFCNIANAPALQALKDMGFSAAIISPELGEEDILSLPGQSPLPLGVTLSGFWPVGITRHRADPLNNRDAFSGPKGESFWMRRYGQNLWLYPSWPLDLSARRPALERAGYSTFVHMDEHPPKNLEQRARPGEFNWNVGML